MASEAEWEAAKNEILRKIGDFGPYFNVKGPKKDSGDWISAKCPLHKDGEEENESFTYHKTKGCWICFAHCGKGSFFDFLCRTQNKEFGDVLKSLAEEYRVDLPGANKDDRPPIKESLIEAWVQNLNADEGVKNWLREKRGLNDKTLADYRIGWDPQKERNTIPIRDHEGVVRNVRLYNKKKLNKIINYTDGKIKYGSPARLFGVGRLAKAKPGSQVLLCEGEWDCLLAIQEGFLAVTGTGGCRTFRKEWAKFFKGMNVVICYDVDAEGRKAVKEIVIPNLAKAECASIKAVWLPLKGTKEEKDITDYFNLDNTAADLQKLIDETAPEELVKPHEQEVVDDEVIELKSFTEISDKKYVNKRVCVDLTVCGQTSDDFHAVDEFKITYCPRIAKGGCVDCKGYPEPAIVPESAREYIGVCMSSDFQVEMMLRKFACHYGQRPNIEILRQSTIKEFFACQKVKRRTHVPKGNTTIELLDGVQQELVERKVYLKSHIAPDPKSYRSTGWVKTHPKTQHVTFLIDKMDPLEEDYESFKVAEHLDVIKAFKAIPFGDLIEDLNRNVTRIYDRDELLIATLLTFLSPRWIPFNEDLIRGWLVTCFVGDAGTGKTQTVTRFSNWVEMGDIFSGLTGSRTGLSYAMVDNKQRGWQIRIGRYPANNGKLLIVDEAQHLPFEDTRTLSKAMEEGFLQVDRVKSQGYQSQTRLILICNPRKDHVMDSFNFGARALRSVFTPTIIRRLDICCFVSQSDITDLNIINRRGRETVESRVTPEMMRALIMWAWKLTPEQIKFDEKATDLCLKKAEEMSYVFGHANEVPLVTISDFRNKLARIATAFAVLRVSANEDMTELQVKFEHVYDAAEFVDKVYRTNAAQLDDFSEITRLSSELVDYDVIMDEFDRKVAHAKHAVDDDSRGFQRVIWAIRTSDVIRRDALIEQADASENCVNLATKLLKRHSLIDSTKDGYIKKPKFNKFLRRYLQERRDFWTTDQAESVFREENGNDDKGPIEKEWLG